MATADVPQNAAAIHAAILRATGNRTLSETDRETLVEFIRQELPAFYTEATTYIVLGSYHQPYIQRLRAAAQELSKRPRSYAAVVGDSRNPSFTAASAFRLKFHIFCTVADWIIGVYEKDTKGESAELGKIAEQPYFEKSFVFPRDYQHLQASLTTAHDFIDAAILTYFDDDQNDTETRAQLEALLADAEDIGVDVTTDDVVEAIKARAEDPTPVPEYSWPHLEDFKHFDLYDRCFVWHVEEELRVKITELPGPPHPSWEHGFNSDSLLPPD